MKYIIKFLCWYNGHNYYRTKTDRKEIRIEGNQTLSILEHYYKCSRCGKEA